MTVWTVHFDSMNSVFLTVALPIELEGRPSDETTALAQETAAEHAAAGSAQLILAGFEAALASGAWTTLPWGAELPWSSFPEALRGVLDTIVAAFRNVCDPFPDPLTVHVVGGRTILDVPLGPQP